MRSPVSLNVVNIFMEHFEEKAIRTAENPPRIWKDCAKDTPVIKHSEELCLYNT